MQRLLRHMPSPAMVVACLALLIALGGATYAAGIVPGANTVGAKQLKKSAVTAPKIAKNAVTGAKVQDDSLTGADVLESSLGKVPSAASADSAANVGRVAQGYLAPKALSSTPASLGSASLTVPAAGWALVQATYNTDGTGCHCEANLQLHEPIPGSGGYLSNLPTTSLETDNHAQTGSVSYLFPVTKGAHSFELVGFSSGGTSVSFDSGELQALYVPFGSSVP